MELFRRRRCHQGFGANHFLFYGSCQTAPRRLFHGIPEVSLNCQENVCTFTANIMRHLHSEERFRSFHPPLSCCLPQPIWEGAGNQENYFCPDVKEVLHLQNEAVLLRVLPFHPSIFTLPSLLPLDTLSRRFRISLAIIQSVSFKI